MAEENTAATEEQQPKFIIQKIYTKDISFAVSYTHLTLPTICSV